MPTHASHDWGETGYCYHCTVHCMSVEAQYTCIPTTAEPPCDTEPQREPAWLEINAEFSGGRARSDEVEL